MVEPVVIRRRYAAEPGRVWAAWTTPAQLEQWYCPNPDAPTTARLEVTPGGEHVVEMGPHHLEGRYSAVEPGKHLAHTWAFRDEPPRAPTAVTVPTMVDVRFEAVEGGTQVTLTHAGFATRADRDGIRQGWELSLPRLDGVLARR